MLCAIHLVVVSAAAQQLDLRHYDQADGLPQSQILTLERDQLGYLWLGTFSGLTRYDGADFDTWTTDDGLRANTVFQLTVAPDGRVIVHSADSVCVVDPGRLDVMPSGSAGGDAIACHPFDLGSVRGLAIDPDGTIWAPTDRGLFALEVPGPSGGEASERLYGLADGLPSLDLRDATVDADGTVWIGTAGGLVRLAAGRFETADGALGTAAITFVAHGPPGIVVGTEDAGVFVRRGSETTAVPLPAVVEDTAFFDAAFDHFERLWIATGRGVVRVDGNDSRLFGRQSGLPSSLVREIEFDGEQVLWLGTDDGLDKLVPGPFATYAMSEGLPNPMVRTLAVGPQGRLWVGTRDGVAVGGVEGFDEIPLRGIDDHRVYGLAAAEAGMLIGTRDGLLWWRGGEIERRWRRGDDGLQSDFVTSLFADGERVWVGTDRGMGWWHEGRYEFLDRPELADSFVMKIRRDRRGRLWVATTSGAFVLEAPERGADSPLRRLGEADGLTRQAIWDLDVDAEGGVWLATNGDGVFHVTAEEDIAHYAVADGLTDPFVWQSLVDTDGAVWLYTNRGLHRFAGGEFTHFGPGEGLSVLEGSATASLVGPDGALWFGTPRGVVRYERDLAPPPLEPPRVVIQSAHSERLGRLESGASVPWSFGGFTLHFAGLSLRDEASVRYRWRIVGGEWSEGAWSAPVVERSLRFASLAPGLHRIEVDAANDAGWSDAPARFELRVTPAPWQTVPFRVGLALVAVGIVLGAVRLRMRRLENERSRLETLVAERTAELEAKTRSLEREIGERTEAERARRSLEERLRQSEKMEAVGRLAGGVAHDFNNLLTSIYGYTELLLAETEPESPQQVDLEEVRRATERATKLTQQLLAFSRRQVIEPVVLHLDPVVLDLVRMLERLLGEDIDLETRLEADPDLVRVDRNQLEQVLVNLAVNARDSMPRGGRLEIGTRFEPEARGDFDGAPGPAVVLEVRDSGEGIEGELLEHIFEPFFTTKERGRGTGLGLATVYGIVRQNGGAVDVDSTPGRGTTFRVVLPAAVGEVAEPWSRPRPSVEIGGGEGLCVLVVEDERSVRTLLDNLLGRAGYRVTTAADCAEALASLESIEEPLSLLIADLVMPGVNGREVAERVVARRPEARVLFMSGYPAKVLGQRGILPAGAEFLPKPFTPQMLFDAVQETLAR
ncbi:MAG: two-component regulator propeller domain-containing protein [Acidobacteriota bacterium]